jgi:hypothetical protein
MSKAAPRIVFYTGFAQTELLTVICRQSISMAKRDTWGIDWEHDQSSLTRAQNFQQHWSLVKATAGHTPRAMQKAPRLANRPPIPRNTLVSP